jgi:hypothetical protein
MKMETQHTKTYKIQQCSAKRKGIAISTYTKKKERFQVNSTNSETQQTRKARQAKPQIGRTKKKKKLGQK